MCFVELKYDVHPYLAEYKNWGNVAELIYGNSKGQRDNNGKYHFKLLESKNLLNSAGDDIIHEHWKSEFKK